MHGHFARTPGLNLGNTRLTSEGLLNGVHAARTVVSFALRIRHALIKADSSFGKWTTAWCNIGCGLESGRNRGTSLAGLEVLLWLLHGCCACASPKLYHYENRNYSSRKKLHPQTHSQQFNHYP